MPQVAAAEQNSRFSNRPHSISAASSAVWRSHVATMLAYAKTISMSVPSFGLLVMRNFARFASACAVAAIQAPGKAWTALNEARIPGH